MNTVRLANQLIQDEGLRLKPYRCTAGKLSIGVGRNLDDRGITEAEAMGLLDNDIKFFWGQLVVKLPWMIHAPEAIQEVLVNMALNLGVPGMLGFSKTLGFIEAGDYAAAAAEMLRSRWAAQVGARAERLAEMVRSCAQEASS